MMGKVFFHFTLKQYAMSQVSHGPNAFVQVGVYLFNECTIS